MRYKGVEKVNGYLIPKKEAGTYKRNMRIARNAAKKAYRQKFPYAISDWKNSEDGEAVIALDKNCKLVACMHLDPQGIQLILEGIKNNNLLEVLLDNN